VLSMRQALGATLLVLGWWLCLAGCGEDVHFAISSDDFDEFEDCDSQCYDLCRSCHASPSEVLDCIDFCEPRCESADCDWDGFSFECEDIFRQACLL
jgi:hypothetical protein